MATLKDVAKKANVSTATVSRIINGKGEASQETIDRVMRVIRELHYNPNRLAQSLSRRKSDLIAVMVPNVQNPFFGELITEIEEYAEKKGLHILLCNTNDDRKSVEYFLDTIVSNYVYGAVIVTDQVTVSDLEMLETKGIPTVTCDRSSFVHPFSAVNVDQYYGAFIVTEHLIRIGARKIVLLAGPKSEPLYADRSNGFLTSLSNHNLTTAAIAHGSFTFESGYQQIDLLIQQQISFDAVFSSNDLMAIGALRACQDHGYRIPNDVKIIGTDNIRLDKFIQPRLTSLSQQKKHVGKLVIEELKERQENGSAPKYQTIKPELILRETT